MKGLFVLPALLLLVPCSGAQVFQGDWFTIDGGGGTSVGGPFELHGTIGQPDAAARITGGVFSVTGGFWGGGSVIATIRPRLTIVPAGPGQATVSWTPDLPEFVLQEASRLSPPAWSNAPSGAANPTTVLVTGTTKFYRLVKP